MRLHQGAIKFGLALVLLRILSTVLAGATHWLTLRRLRRGDDLVLTRWPLSITIAMLVAVMGLAGLWFAMTS
ncbi:MAG: hypothetical protein ND895_15190 [Pyrinomonadaceae bacterium]|nr:hypothetical protein [Pyrinomonadaceae bacterium]